MSLPYRSLRLVCAVPSEATCVLCDRRGETLVWDLDLSGRVCPACADELADAAMDLQRWGFAIPSANLTTANP